MARIAIGGFHHETNCFVPGVTDYAYFAQHRDRPPLVRDDEIFDLQENESVFIPLGSTHYLENPTDQPLDIIEVQSGSYLGEDDIVRFDDMYGRSDEQN